jgi:hypothetical protein
MEKEMDRANHPELSSSHFVQAARDVRILDLSNGEAAHPKKVRHSSIRLNSIPDDIFGIVRCQ